MEFPKDLKYTKTHEWAKREGSVVRMGVTNYAQKEIADVVFVELPKAGRAVEQAKPLAVVESVKAAFDIYAPVSGSVKTANKQLESKPELVNQDCYGQGWFCEMEMTQAAEWDSLMSAEAYENHIKQESAK